MTRAAFCSSTIIAAWFAWRYFKLRRDVDEFASRARNKDTSTNIKDLENLSSAISSIHSTFNTQYSTLDAERARLATVLDQITDGVLIADSQGIIQFANPAAGRLFQAASLIEKSIVEVVRNHQLVEAWRRCQQTRQMQSESVELPTRHQYLQLVVIPDQRSSGSLLLVQDLTRIRRLETVRRDFISNLSHELRTPLASLKALTDCAWWAFRQVSQLAFFRWQDMVKDIEKVWRAIQEKAWAVQAKIEAEALTLFKQDPAKARAYLTTYSHEIANGAVDAYWKLAEDLWSKYTNLF